MTPTSPETVQHTADLLRMTRESMNGSFTAKLAAAGAPLSAASYLCIQACNVLSYVQG